MFNRVGAFALLVSSSHLLAQGTVTFHRDVLPILQNRCQGCHRSGEAAPFSLLTYEEARPWARAIREAVLLKKMPPWFASSAHGTFENDRSLSAAEIQTLRDWADSGAPAGDRADAPKPLEFTDGWTIGKPDAVIEMPNDFEVPASGIIDYQFIAIPTGFTEDKWVETLEVRPGNRAVVHHVVVFAREPGSPYFKQLQHGVPSAAPNSGIRKRVEDRGEGFWSLQAGAEIICTYVPGGVPYRAKPGQARLIKAGSDLLFQMHYTTNGNATKDRTRIGMVFAKEPPKERVKNMLVLNPNLRIPAGAGNHRVDARVTLNAPATVNSFFPHMHVRGKAFEYRVVYPTGESEVLLEVPRYDFNWQLTYYLDKPRALPKGTRIECTAYYDNSPNNRYNPDSKSDVFWGDQTWEEMLAGFLDLAFDVKMDPASLASGRNLRTE
jgi:hypothetical protein